MSKAHWPVTTLGPGRRIGLWLQGCSIRCAGCVSMDTWDSDAGARTDVADVLDWCRSKQAEGPDGVTISGGEPFDQPEALESILDGLRSWSGEMGTELDVACYSGCPHDELSTRHPGILAKLDVVVTEPFVARLPWGGAWRGSSNPRVVRLTALGARRWIDEPQDKQMQVSVDSEGAWLIGIPQRGDLARIEAALLERGVRLGGVSWRP